MKPTYKQFSRFLDWTSSDGLRISSDDPNKLNKFVQCRSICELNHLNLVEELRLCKSMPNDPWEFWISVKIRHPGRRHSLEAAEIVAESLTRIFPND